MKVPLLLLKLRRLSELSFLHKARRSPKSVNHISTPSTKQPAKRKKKKAYTDTEGLLKLKDKANNMMNY